MSIRQISASTKSSVGAVQKLLGRADALGLSWPLDPTLGEPELARLFYPRADTQGPGARFQEPDWTSVRSELSLQALTKRLLWEEYTAEYPTRCYSYSQYCALFQQWLKHELEAQRFRTRLAGTRRGGWRIGQGEG